MAKPNESQPGDTSANDEAFHLDPTRLVEGVRDFLLRNVRENGMKKPWPKMTEGEQQLEIERATDRASGLVRDVVDLIAQGEFSVIHAIVDNFKIKDGEVTITAKGLAEDDVLLTLNHAGKKSVKIIVADAQQFDQSRSNIEPDADEPALPGVTEPVETLDDDRAMYLKAVEICRTEKVSTSLIQRRLVIGYNKAAMFISRMEEQGLVSEADSNGIREYIGQQEPAPTTDEIPVDEAEQAEGAAILDQLNYDPDTGEVHDDGEVGDGPGPDAEGEIELGSTAPDAAVRDGDGAGPDALDEALGEPEPTVDRPALTPPEEPVGLTENQRMEARNAGIDARKNGFAKSKNPHDKGSESAEIWAKGYDDEKAAEKARGD